MADLYSSDVLIAVVQNLKRPETFLLQRFFPRVIEETSEEIHFDIEADARRLAPFVSPMVQGKIVEGQGYETRTFRPAYIKDKRVFDANRPMKRIIGEQISGTLSPMQRQQALIAQELQDQLWMLMRRKEVMACEALRTGKTTVKGEGYPTVIVDFQRSASHTKQLLTTARWGETNVSPVDDLESWAEEILQDSGVAPTDVVIEIDAWKLLRADPKFKDAVELRRAGMSQVEIGPMVEKQAVYIGNLGNLRLWRYQDWYVDPDTEVETPLLPQYQVIITSQALEGVQQHGAIRDEDAGYQATEWWPKSWVEKDPSVRYLLMQSAPLMVPTRPDASMGILVR